MASARFANSGRSRRWRHKDTTDTTDTAVTQVTEGAACAAMYASRVLDCRDRVTAFSVTSVSAVVE